MHQVVALFITLTASLPAQIMPEGVGRVSESESQIVIPHKQPATAVTPASTSRVAPGAMPKIFGPSLLLGGVLGGVGGYIGFQLGQRQAQGSCAPLESCTAEWVLPFSGMLLGAGAGFIFAPGYVAGQAGYRCDMDSRILAFGGGAILGTALVALGLASNDIEALAAGISAPWVFPTWACLGSLEPVDPVEGY